MKRLIYPDDGSAFWTITGNVLDPQSGPWLFVWIDRIHDLTIDSNHTTAAEVRNDGHNIQPTNTHVVDKPWPAEVQASSTPPAWSLPIRTSLRTSWHGDERVRGGACTSRRSQTIPYR